MIRMPDPHIAAVADRERVRSRLEVQALTTGLCDRLGLSRWDVIERPALMERTERLAAVNRQLRADLARVRRANRPRDARGRFTR